MAMPAKEASSATCKWDTPKGKDHGLIRGHIEAVIVRVMWTLPGLILIIPGQPYICNLLTLQHP